jgi:hypothetical protein
MEPEAVSVSPSNSRSKSLLVKEVTKSLRTKFRKKQEVPNKGKFNMEGSLLRSSYRQWEKHQELKYPAKGEYGSDIKYK